ncbi:MAG: hypothetical protein LBC88_07775 [Spirochaetaceae bacterium]|nr:hypothetical protein [Spirochaetaceae bacterium]
MKRRVKTLLLEINLLGAAIALVLLGILGFTLIQPSGRPRGGGLFSPRPKPTEISFSRLLREYDAARNAGNEGAVLGRLLDQLESRALGVESHLSALKRRRALVMDGGVSSPAEAYRDAALRAAEKFPASELLAAVAAEALLCAGDTAKAAAFAAALTEADLLPLSLAVSVLAGDYAYPAAALAKPESGGLLNRTDFFTTGADGGLSRAGEVVIRNAALLRVIRGNPAGAAPLVQILTSARAGDAAGETSLRFAAEYYYDFGNPRRAAELFARFGGEWALSREADALSLAGDSGAAETIWAVLAAPGADGIVRTGQDILQRSLYNLASARGAENREAAFERLLRAEPNHRYGLIGYTRLLPPARARAILEGASHADTDPLIGLERLRRLRETERVERIIPETWLLINRHRDALSLYEWGLWYFDFQKQYAESARLEKSLVQYAALNGGEPDAPWLDFYRGRALIRAGDYAGAEAAFLALVKEENASWEASANLGRLLEARRAPAAALARYEEAFVRAGGNAEKARLLYRMSRVLRALGRDHDARIALEEGLALDGTNILIGMELNRLDSMGIF